MPEPIVSVCWEDHTTELSIVYKDLLKNNFLVDCTLSAGGQSIKAHRLVLSACSPYFQTLFCEETERHPFIVLLHVTFETMKAVIDFVYRGEVQIPEGKLEAFLTLAQSLQIKGLNGFTTKCMTKNLSGSTPENISHVLPKVYQNICGKQNIREDKDSLENSSQEQGLNTECYTNVLTDSSVPFEACRTSQVEVQTASVVTPLQKLLECDEVSIETEISVKHEPLYAAFSETNNTLENNKSDEPITGDFMYEMEVGTDAFQKQDFNQYLSCSESLRRRGDSSVMPHDSVYSVQNTSKQHEHLPPMVLLPKRERMEMAESGELLNVQDVVGNEVNEGIQFSCSEENLSQCSKRRPVRPGNPKFRKKNRQPRNVRNSQYLSSVSQHLPIVGTYRRCAFCSSRNNGKRSNLICEACDKALCKSCFKPFHESKWNAQDETMQNGDEQWWWWRRQENIRFSFSGSNEPRVKRPPTVLEVQRVFLYRHCYPVS